MKHFFKVAGIVMRGVLGMKPSEEEVAERPVKSVRLNTTGSAVMVADSAPGRWERLTATLVNTPLIQTILEGARALKESEVGKAAQQVKTKIDDSKEALREKWETSQHPLVYNASSAYEGVFAETEWAQSIRTIRQIDPSFSVPEFTADMKDVIIPEVVKAFLTGDRKVLARRCKESAINQLGAVFRAREAEGLTMDANILSISNVEVSAAKVLAKGPAVLIVSSMVQQINCITNAKGEVVEGNEDEIRAVFYAFAMVREYDPDTASLHWRVLEMSVVGSQLYL